MKAEGYLQEGKKAPLRESQQALGGQGLKEKYHRERHADSGYVYLLSDCIISRTKYWGDL